MPTAELAFALMALGAITALGAAVTARRGTASTRMWGAVGIPFMCAIPSSAALVAMQLARRAVVGGTTSAAIAIGAAALGLTVGVGLVAMRRTLDGEPASAMRRDTIVIAACALISVVVVGAGEVAPLEAQLLLIAALAWCWLAQPSSAPDAALGHGERGTPDAHASNAMIALAGVTVCAAGIVLGVLASVPGWTIEIAILLCGLTSALFAHASHRRSPWLGPHAICAAALALTIALAIGGASIAHVLDMARSLPEWSLNRFSTAIGISLAAAPRIKGLAGALPHVVLVIAAFVALASLQGAQGARTARQRSLGIAVLVAVGLMAAMRIAAHFRS